MTRTISELENLCQGTDMDNQSEDYQALHDRLGQELKQKMEQRAIYPEQSKRISTDYGNFDPEYIG